MGLVKISASWSCVGTWIKAIFPFSMSSLRNDTSLLCALFWSEELGSSLHLWHWCCHIEVGYGYTPQQSHGVCDPKELRATTSCGHILRLGSGLSNTRLIAGRPRHERRTKELASPRSDDRDDLPTVGANVGVLYPATSIRGTRRRVDSGGSPDLELEGMREDTRHDIYTGSGSQSSVPYVLFGVVLRPSPRSCSPEGLWMFC
jgi:hypothetical protein